MTLFIDNLLTDMINGFVNYVHVGKCFRAGFIQPYEMDGYFTLEDSIDFYVETYQLDYLIRCLGDNDSDEILGYHDYITDHFLNSPSDRMFKHSVNLYREYLCSIGEPKRVYISKLEAWIIIASNNHDFAMVKFLIDERIDFIEKNKHSL